MNRPKILQSQIRDFEFIRNHVSIGNNAPILSITIAGNLMIRAGSVVTKDILVSGIYAGNPTKLFRKL